jgi:hypothetical protein
VLPLSCLAACRAQAFASPQRLAEMVAMVRTALGTALPEAVAKMKLYLNNPATHAVRCSSRGRSNRECLLMITCEARRPQHGMHATCCQPK